MMWVDRLNDQRHNVSSVVSLFMVGAIWFMTQSIMPVQRSLSEEPIELSLLTPEPVRPETRPPVPPPPVQVPKPTPTLAKPTPAPLAPAAMPAPSTVASVTAPATPSAPTETVRMEATKPAQAAPAVTAPAVAETVRPAPPPPPSSAAIENGYVVSVRSLLNANKRYPTGREASLQRPSGKAVVWFVLNRNGTLQEAGIEGSSNSILLDNAALSTVRRTSYTPWPEGSWPGQTQHRFTVTLDFVSLS